MSAIEGALTRAPSLKTLTAPVVVACSGGADSLALLVLAERAGLAPIAVHVDHGLRDNSADDAQFVSKVAESLGVRSTIRRVHVEAGSNLEARARDARYAELEWARDEHHATVILVAHTADDQAETVLLNLMRGAGTTGLSGMPQRRAGVVRPLLGLRRTDTEAVCAEAGLEPVADPMNEDLAYKRVWVRNEVLPLMARGVGRDVVAVLARQAELLRAEADFLDELAEESWPGDAGATSAELLTLPPVLARRAVRRWLGAPPPRQAEVEAVLAVARGERRAVDLAGGRRVARRFGELRVESARKPSDYGLGA